MAFSVSWQPEHFTSTSRCPCANLSFSRALGSTLTSWRRSFPSISLSYGMKVSVYVFSMTAAAISQIEGTKKMDASTPKNFPKNAKKFPHLILKPPLDENKLADRSRYSTSSIGEPLWTATDLAKGFLDVHGWKVLLQETGEQVGIVDEIIHIGPPDSDEIFESVMKLVQASGPSGENLGYRTSEVEDDEEVDSMEFLVPLVEDIVRGVDVSSRCLFITPPEGLLELARIPELLKRLKPQLLEFCQQQNAGIRSCLDNGRAERSSRFSEDAKQLVAWSRDTRQQNSTVFMPTRRQLQAAGRQDLIENIMAAGGFLAVAQALRLRSRRRPVGFWEDLRNLDAEIEWFVSGSWTIQQSPVTGEDVYYNHATEEFTTQKPPPGSVSNPVPVSQDDIDVGTAVMPRQQQVLEAGRYDLHHAILLHGGYKLVAGELGRQPVARDSSSKLVAKLKSFMEEKAISRLPSFEDLRAYQRKDLVYSLRKHGGINSLAQMMDIRPKRYGRGQWNSLECGAAAIRSYICEQLINERGLRNSHMDRCEVEDMVWEDASKSHSLQFPTQARVLEDGRSDLRYLMQKYGRKQLADYLNIEVINPRRRRGAPGA